MDELTWRQAGLSGARTALPFGVAAIPLVAVGLAHPDGAAFGLGSVPVEAAIGACLLSAAIAGYLGGVVFREIWWLGLVVALTVGWAVAVIAVPLLPIVFGHEGGVGILPRLSLGEGSLGPEPAIWWSRADGVTGLFRGIAAYAGGLWLAVLFGFISVPLIVVGLAIAIGADYLPRRGALVLTSVAALLLAAGPAVGMISVAPGPAATLAAGALAWAALMGRRFGLAGPGGARDWLWRNPDESLEDEGSGDAGGAGQEAEPGRADEDPAEAEPADPAEGDPAEGDPAEGDPAEAGSISSGG